MGVGDLIRMPSAFLPIAMSCAALGLLLWYVAAFGVVRQADEGTAARIYQLLMVTQVPIAAWFALSWLPRAPRPALVVLALQLAAALVTFAPLFVLETG